MSGASYDDGYAEVTINGQDITPFVHTIHVSHSLTDNVPAAYASLRIHDSTGILAGPASAVYYEPKVPITLMYTDPTGINVRQYQMVSAGLSQGEMSPSLKSQAHDLMATTESFFNAQQLASYASKGEPAAAAISNLHSKFVMPGSGLSIPGTKILGEMEHYLVSNKEVISAIHDIRKRCVTTDQFKSNSLLYFMDQLGQFHLDSLENLLQTASGTRIRIAKPGADGVPNLGNETSLAATSVHFNIEQDDTNAYYQASSQEGGKPNNQLLDNHSVEYIKGMVQQYDPGATLSSALTTIFGGGPIAALISHNPLHDSILQSKAPHNVDRAQAKLQQAAAAGAPFATVNIRSLEPQLDVGKGVYLDIPDPYDDGAGGRSGSNTKGTYLITGKGDYINLSDQFNRVIVSFEAIMTAKG